MDSFSKFLKMMRFFLRIAHIVLQFVKNSESLTFQKSPRQFAMTFFRWTARALSSSIFLRHTHTHTHACRSGIGHAVCSSKISAYTHRLSCVVDSECFCYTCIEKKRLYGEQSCNNEERKKVY